MSRTADVVDRSAERVSSGPGSPGFDPSDYLCALGLFAIGVAVVTIIDLSGRPIGLTVNSFRAVSLHPTSVPIEA